MSVLLIVERNLHNEMGHLPGQIRAISQFSSAESIHVVTWSGTEKLPLSAQPDRQPERIRLHSVLVSSREVGKPTDPESLAKTEAQILTRIASEAGASISDTIVMPSAITHDLRVALEVAASDGPRIVARVLALTFFETLSTAEIDALRTHQKTGRIHLSCETEEFCEAVRDQFDLVCPADFVLPCNVLPNDSVPDRVPSDTFRVGMLGGPRGEKGSYRVSAIVRSIAAHSRKMQNPSQVTLVVQTSLGLRMRTLSMLWPLLKAKLSSGNPRIEIIWGAQSKEDFRSTLFGLDCILLPYRLDRYATSGSGMIIDAVNAAIPIIRTRGMAMSKLMSFGNSLAVTTDDEIATAILDMAADPDPFVEAAKHARTALQARVSQLPFQ
ncbi:hypothetical protein [Celeribacter sp.]|uniref:hypothetical protein n=1 Tax=Celeribacter sp. TaxID=1890673 RepID=UPI003A952B87